MNLINALADPNLFGRVVTDLSTWEPWLVVLKGLYGVPMNEQELTLFTELTARTTPPTTSMREGWFVVGRRGRKSLVAALIAAYQSAFLDYRAYLKPGEIGVFMVISQNRRQAKVVMNYLRAFFTEIPMLSAMVRRVGSEFVELNNNVTIEIHTANFRSVRGFTCVGAALDESAYWPTEDSAIPDYETVTAIRPAMSTIPSAMLIGLSSPYRRAGVLWEAHKDHYGQNDSDVLVVQADTAKMNPLVDQRVIDEAYRKDPQSARAEYGAQFRDDLAAFVDYTAVQAVVTTNVTVRHYIEGQRYFAFVDPSGGSADSFTLAIAHNEKNIPTLDLLVERKPPFSPEAVTAEFAALLKQYKVYNVVGDRYSGEFVRELFRKHGISYKVSEKNRSELYLELLPLINSGNVQLLDNQTLINQLCALERRTSNIGKDSIDHRKNSHDDVANAAAGVVSLLVKKPAELVEVRVLSTGRPVDEDELEWSRLNGGYLM